MDLIHLTIARAHQGLLKKEFSAVELTKEYLNKIKNKDKEISAFLTVSDESALEQARQVDEMLFEAREIPLLAGIPLAVKDIILVEDIKCTAGSKILENYIAPYDATVIKKLKAQAAVILGKTNLDEFAMGSSTEHSVFKITRNPKNLMCVPGGSSGGSAAAVAADECIYALGSDTGGSVRQPASFCGLVGLKPTYGAVSRYGLMAMASSLDQIGPLTKNVEDARIVFQAIAGKDELDSTSVDKNFQFSIFNFQSSSNFQFSNVKIGVPKEYFVKGIAPEVEEIVIGAIKKLEELGAKMVEISLPHTEYALACYYIIMASEVSANLARYDGIKYGFSKKSAKDLFSVYAESRGEGFGEEVRCRLMLGTFALSAGYYDAYYLRAQKVRTLIILDFERAFEKVDLILTPTSPTPAFKLGEKLDNPLTMYLSDIFTVSANLAGLPAVSIPAGETKEGLPVGMQLIGQPFEEEVILETAEMFEKMK